MIFLSLLLTLSVDAQAQAEVDCKSIPKALSSAAPADAARLFVQLAECNPAAAKKAAAGTFPKLLVDGGGEEAAMAAIKAGAGEVVRDWMHTTLEAEDRSPMIRNLGKVCGKDEAVQGFLGDSASALGEDFWTQRWYRALVDCRVPAIQKILTDYLAVAEAGDDRVRFFAVVSAWAQNVGGAAVPKLEEMISKSEDTEVQVSLLQAFTDAAQVGTLAGMDVKAAEEGAAAIKRLSVNLPAKAVDQARITLQALDDEEGADSLAKVRYNALVQSDDVLLYGVVVVETATCKNGKAQQFLHVAEVSDPGQTWPDQLADAVGATIKQQWKLNLAERCKGEGTTETKLPSAPFADKAAFKAWVDDQFKAVKREDVKKQIRKDYDRIAL